MQIDIPTDLEAFVEQEFATGRYATGKEVVVKEVVVQSVCWLREERQ